MAFVVVGLAGSACHGSSSEGPQADEYFYDCEKSPAGTTVFATDENFAAFVNKEAAGAVVKDDTRAPRLVTPAPGSSISLATPPQFTIQGLQVRAPSASQRPAWARACPRPPRASWWRRFRQNVSLEGMAQAHCGAVSGVNDLLRINDGGKAIYTAMLSVTTFTPDAAVWKAATAGRVGHTVTVSIERAELLQGQITAGPFVATVAPTLTLVP